MKNHIKWLGIIALLTVIGLSFAACNNDGMTSAEKTIKITGIPTEYLTATNRVRIYGTDGKVLAAGIGQFSGSTGTFDLYIMKQTENGYQQTSDRWTGKGTLGVQLVIIYWQDVNNDKYFNAQAISITDAVTTIPFSQFQVQ